MTAPKNGRAPILITGCPRSGTTWVGSTVGRCREVMLVYEPFNCDAPHHLTLSERYMYFQSDDRSDTTLGIRALAELGSLRVRARLAAGALLRGRHYREDLTSFLALRELVRFPGKFLGARRTCFKDPLAFFAAEWMARQLSAKVVVMIRHPAGMISSYMKLGWAPEVQSLVGQRGLRTAFAGPLEEDLAAVPPNDTVGQLILQWKLFAEAALAMRARHPEWLFVSHEGVCKQPIARFREIFKYLELPWTRAVEHKIRVDTTAEQVDPAQHRQHVLQRNSMALASAWKVRLGEDVISRIEADTGSLWGRLSTLDAVAAEGAN